MGVDTYVLLRVRDRQTLRSAIRTYAEKDRARWVDDGRAAAYERLVADGYDPTPLMKPLDDGSVAIFTGLRFHDPDMAFSIRSWLAARFGDALPRIHDDERGVYVYPDVCDPRGRTYDGLIAELSNAGHFIDPSPPTDEERAVRDRELDELIAASDACRKAQESGDEEAFAKALGAAPEAVRQMWIDFLPRLQAKKEEMAADPKGFGRVAMLLPAVIAEAMDKHRHHLDIQERFNLADGSAIIVTSRSELDFEAQILGQALGEAGVDARVTVGALPFFRESLVPEAVRGTSFDEVKSLLGNRAELFRLRTLQERMADDRADVVKWLDEE